MIFGLSEFLKVMVRERWNRDSETGAAGVRMLTCTQWYMKHSGKFNQCPEKIASRPQQVNDGNNEHVVRIEHEMTGVHSPLLTLTLKVKQ